jgi:N-acyl-L-homoserine lactone synthetase
MFLLIEAHEYDKHAWLLTQSMKLRKKASADRLCWTLTVQGANARDSYDDFNPAYLIWCDEDKEQLYGSGRLMPTTGPTLLYDVFRDTFPHSCDLIAPGIWEMTRMCIDEAAVSRDFPDLRPEQALCLLHLALAEAALENGIHTLISNFEPHTGCIYEKVGAKFDELGRAHVGGRSTVCCGAFEVSPGALAQMRREIKVVGPLYRRVASTVPVARAAARPSV